MHSKKIDVSLKVIDKRSKKNRVKCLNCNATWDRGNNVLDNWIRENHPCLKKEESKNG